MKIKSIDIFPIVMPVKAVVTSPRGASRTLAEGKQNILVRITDEDGDIGWGEAGPSRRWSSRSPGKIFGPNAGVECSFGDSTRVTINRNPSFQFTNMRLEKADEYTATGWN